MFYEKYLSNLNLNIEGEKLNSIIYENHDISNNLYTQQISDNIKHISNNKLIREYVTSIQRKLSENNNVVCEGRDIGSVVFPHADIKFFLKCNIEERVRRRYDQFFKNNIIVDKKKLKKKILNRDNNDMNRKNSPLKITDDSIAIDTTSLTLDNVIKIMCEKIKDKYVK